jgi:hypothetical protein
MKQIYSIKENFNSFLFGIIYFIHTNIIGAVYVGEIISIIYLIFNIRKITISNEIKSLIKITALYMLIVLISDVYNSNSINNFIKGFTAPLLILFSIIFLFNFFKDRKKLFLMFIFGGFFLKLFLVFNFTELLRESDNPWKWGLGIYLISLIYLFELLLDKKFSIGKILIINLLFLVISLYFASRGLSLIVIISTIFFLNSRSKNNFLKLFQYKSTFLIIPVLILLFIILFSFMNKVTNNFIFFDKLNKKNELQRNNNSNILFSARPEFYIYSSAFIAKPFFGHGSYPRDINLYYRSKLNFYLYDNYIINFLPKIELDKLYSNEIPTHSYIFESLIAHGLFSIIYWLVISYTIIKTYSIYASQMSLFYHLKIIIFCYSLFFSPFNFIERLNLEILISLLILNFRMKTNYD